MPCTVRTNTESMRSVLGVCPPAHVSSGDGADGADGTGCAGGAGGAGGKKGAPSSAEAPSFDAPGASFDLLGLLPTAPSPAPSAGSLDAALAGSLEAAREVVLSGPPTSNPLPIPTPEGLEARQRWGDSFASFDDEYPAFCAEPEPFEGATPVVPPVHYNLSPRVGPSSSPMVLSPPEPVPVAGTVRARVDALEEAPNRQQRNGFGS